MYNFVPLNGGRAEYKFASKDDGRNVFEQGKRRVMLATLLGPPAAIEDTGRPACTERAVRHAVENNRRELSDERKAHYPTDRRRTSSTVDEQTDRLAARPTASSVAASKRRAVRHARDGPSGMQETGRPACSRKQCSRAFGSSASSISNGSSTDELDSLRKNEPADRLHAQQPAA